MFDFHVLNNTFNLDNSAAAHNHCCHKVGRNYKHRKKLID